MKKIILCKDGFVIKDDDMNFCFYDHLYICETDEKDTLTVEEARKRVYVSNHDEPIRTIKEIMEDIEK